ncbi:hypothetical protein BO99DRAFT_178064 [Aspergillus violaceofuscus CBS 115571]|uniref:Uncharacterized protein n=1 Tax=Aspergillus violaceofuscus (strain CBS 115571) TaxID=1450538 RepID=A0A2V5HP51_ASPV1|nr:hypothetical protein BO99DRAFT_178064 [Aspergillus violaceofuscus CBS 115571]
MHVAFTVAKGWSTARLGLSPSNAASESTNRPCLSVVSLLFLVLRVSYTPGAVLLSSRSRLLHPFSTNNDMPLMAGCNLSRGKPAHLWAQVCPA